MFWFFVAVLLALAGCAVLVIRGRRTSITDETVGFVYVGAAGLAAIAVAVLVVGLLSGVPGRAEGLALLGLGAYVIYLLAAWAVIRFVRFDR